MIRFLSDLPPSRDMAQEYNQKKVRERIQRQYKLEKALGPPKVGDQTQVLPLNSLAS